VTGGAVGGVIGAGIGIIVGGTVGTVVLPSGDTIVGAGGGGEFGAGVGIIIGAGLGSGFQDLGKLIGGGGGFGAGSGYSPPALCSSKANFGVGSHYLTGSGVTIPSGKVKTMGDRGWNPNRINDVVNNPSHVSPARNKANGQPATAYFDSDGNYVSVENGTGHIVQGSDTNNPEWLPDKTISNPP